MQFPKPVHPGSTIGVTAPSFGATTEPYATRFAEAERKFKERGYKILAGETCRMSDGLGISTNPRKAAEELERFYCSGDTDAVISCGGGELMCETMSFINLERIAAARPKWFMGYSDNTNFIFPLATCCQTAGIYSHCFTGFGKPWEQSEKDALALLEGTSYTVNGYDRYQLPEAGSEAKAADPLSPYILTEKKTLSSFLPEADGRFAKADGGRETSFSGMLLGGCLDVLANLTGTKFDNMAAFNRNSGGVIWVLEACDLNPMDIRRAVWHLDACGWFRNATGFLIGRPLAAFKQEMMGVDCYNAVTDILEKYRVPVIMDADIGHIAPAVPLIIGSHATVNVKGDELRIQMECS